MEVSVRVGGHVVDAACEGAILLSGDGNIEERDAAISFHFQGEVDVSVQAVEMVQEELEVCSFVLPDDKCVIDIPEPNPWSMFCCDDGGLFKLLHEQVSQNRGYK